MWQTSAEGSQRGSGTRHPRPRSHSCRSCLQAVLKAGRDGRLPMSYIFSSNYAFCKGGNWGLWRLACYIVTTALWSLGTNQFREGVQVCVASTWPGWERVWEAWGQAIRGHLNLTSSYADLRQSPGVHVVREDAPHPPKGRPRASHGFLLETIGGSSCSSHVSSCTFFTFFLDLARLGHCHLKK